MCIAANAIFQRYVLKLHIVFQCLDFMIILKFGHKLKLLLFHTLIQEAEHPTMKPASLKKDLSIIHIKHYTHDMAQGLFYPKGQIR